MIIDKKKTIITSKKIIKIKKAPTKDPISTSQISPLTPTNQTIFTKCPECFKIPSITLLPRDPSKIKIQCSCSYSTIHKIKDYLHQIKNEQREICHQCQGLRHSTIESAIEFCPKCKNWLCQKCVEYHNKLSKDHNTNFSMIDVLETCPKHTDNQIISYCQNCSEHLCIQCIKSHLEHEVFDLDEISSKIDINKINEDYKRAEKMLSAYNKEIKERIVGKLRREITTIEELYQKNKEINKGLLEMIKIFIENFNNISKIKDFNTLSNLVNNTEFNFDLCDLNDYYSLSKEIANIKNYFSHHLIIKYELNLDQSINLIKKINNQAEIYSLAVLQDKRLASCSSDGTIKIFNTFNYKCDISIENAHNDKIYSISKLKTNQILSCSEDSSIKIWSILSTDEYCLDNTINRHSDAVNKVIELSKEMFASCSFDSTIKIWESINPYNEVVTLKGHKHSVTSILKLKQQDVLASCSLDRTLRFWDLVTFGCKQIIKGVYCTSSEGMFELDNKIVVGSINPNKLVVINLSNFIIEKKLEDSLFENTDWSWHGVFSFIDYKDNMVICGCPSGAVLQFNKTSIEKIDSKENIHNEGVISFVQIDNKTIATCSCDRTIKIFEVI